jgi:tRNA nucleotidyltransferase (CCA-adding enzyme)
LVQIDTHDQLLARALAAGPIAEISRFVDASGISVYLVGGTVRDLMLGRRFVDVDLAVDGETLELAASIGSAQPLSESRFSTLSVSRDGVRYDIARTRSERYARPGALPEVMPAPIATDLLRRDFTINALALAMTGAEAGTLLAAPGALDDLGRRELAVLHDASFEDDPTRLLRIARYSARLDFAIAPHTRRLASEAVADGALHTISGTRIGNELRLLATEPDPVAAFEAVAALGLPWDIDAPIARAALEALPADGRPDLLVLALVLGSNEQLIDELDRLAFTATDRDAIAEAARAPDLARRLADVHTRSEIARTVGTAGIETVALASSQGSPSQSRTWLRDLRHLSLKITGQDLIENGVPEGPAIGRALANAKDALMDGTASDRDSQLRVALQTAE